MRHPYRIIPVALALLLATGVDQARTSAQQNPRTLGGASGPTTTIDFLAVDAKGLPVSDLTAADLAVKIDGKPRAVHSLELVKRDAPMPAGAAATTPPADPLPSPFGTNVVGAGSGRVAYIIFDSDTMALGREQRVKDAINVYLNNLGPKDQVAVVTVPRGGVSTALTTDINAVRAAVAQLQGSAATSGETTDDATCRSRLTVQAVTGVLEQRAGATTPTDVMFVSSNLFGPRQTVSIGGQGGGRAGSASAGSCEFSNEEFVRLGAAAMSARARVYVIRPEDGVVPTVSGGNANTRGSDSPLVGLENIAGITGGLIWHMAGTDVPSFQRIARETSAYYVATVELDPADPNAASRLLSVKTTRPDVEIRARPSLVFARGAAAGGAKLAPKDMMKVPTVYRDVPLRVSAFASRNTPTDTKVKIVAVAEPVSDGIKLSAASIAIYDAAGKLAAQWSADAAALAGSALIGAFVQNPGKYRVRVAVTDSAGRPGTADVDVDATLTPAAGKLTLSAMVLGTADAGFTPKLQFSTEQQGVAYFELYGGAPGMPVSVTMELATSVNGPAIAQLQPKISASAEPDKFIIMTPIAVGPLPSGSYIVRAIVGLDGQPATRIMRTLKKVQ